MGASRGIATAGCRLAAYLLLSMRPLKRSEAQAGNQDQSLAVTPLEASSWPREVRRSNLVNIFFLLAAHLTDGSPCKQPQKQACTRDPLRTSCLTFHIVVGGRVACASLVLESLQHVPGRLAPARVRLGYFAT